MIINPIHVIDHPAVRIRDASLHPLATPFALVCQAIVVVHQLVHQNVYHILNAHRTELVRISNALIHVLVVFAA